MSGRPAIDLGEVNAILSDDAAEDDVVMVSRRWLRVMRDEIARGRLARAAARRSAEQDEA